jgi:hypothetical protein
MFSTIKRIGFITGLSLFLASCVTIHTVKHELLYSPEYIAWAAQDGSLPVEITGNPLGVTMQAGDRLLAAIEMPAWIGPRKFHQIAPADRGEGHRLVLVFNPVSNITSGNSLCKNSAVETTEPGPRTKIIAALCSARSNVSRATAEADIQPDLNNPEFLEMVNSLLRAAMPFRNPEHETSECQKIPCA